MPVWPWASTCFRLYRSMGYILTSESATVASAKNPRGIHPLSSYLEVEFDFVLAVTYVLFRSKQLGLGRYVIGIILWYCSQGGAGNAGSAGSISGAADSFSGLSLGKEDAPSPTENSTAQSAAPVIDCKCGMPLCICEAPKPEPAPVKVGGNLF